MPLNLKGIIKVMIVNVLEIILALHSVLEVQPEATVEDW